MRLNSCPRESVSAVCFGCLPKFIEADISPCGHAGFESQMDEVQLMHMTR